ncbi:DUF3592 domain-containing protein [Nocardiopsis sp. YSL2]|uniref:DUF3592 domain-containing protein n=1 Tax=Nocardiopsis sp. YSL2 TaxID=2939492 RepID=UPI0026F47007|nr:DUF3592 domain-containing protein [Nocardiopsis sp. YSL2]
MEAPDQDVVEFTERLLDDRSRKAPPGLAWPSVLLTGFFSVLLGAVLGMLTGQAFEHTLKQIAFAHDAVRAEATVLAVVDGEARVSFRAEGGAEVVSDLPGAYSHADGREVEVLYLPYAPRHAVGIDDEWRPWALLLPLGLVSCWVVLAHHRLGVRAEWFFLRVRRHVKGPPEQPRRAWPLVVLGGVLAVGAVVPSLWLLAAHDRTALLADAVPLPALMPAGACAVSAVVVLVRAAYRYAKAAPVRRFPRVFRLLPYGVGRAVGGALLLVLVVSFGFRYVSAHQEPEDPVEGIAQVAGTESRCRFRGPCEPYVVLRYEADGIAYETAIRARTGELRDLGADDTLEVRWEADDPAEVRPAEEP